MSLAKWFSHLLALSDDKGIALFAGGKSKSAGDTYAAAADPQEVVALVAGKEIQRTAMTIEPAEGATWQWFSNALAISEAYSVPMALAAPKLGKNTVAGEALKLRVQGGDVAVDIEYVEVDP